MAIRHRRLASLDIQSVKTTESAGSRGFDGSKKIKVFLASTKLPKTQVF